MSRQLLKKIVTMYEISYIYRFLCRVLIQFLINLRQIFVDKVRLNFIVWWNGMNLINEIPREIFHGLPSEKHCIIL